MHAFELVAVGPPVLSARCTCAAWHLAWTEDQLQGFQTVEPAITALVAAWNDHATARRDLAERSARDPGFY